MNIIITPITLLELTNLADEHANLVVIAISSIAGTGIFFTAGMLWRTGREMSRVLAIVLFTTALETVFATIAVPYRHGTWSYVICKLLGRIIQLGGIAYFLQKFTKG